MTLTSKNHPQATSLRRRKRQLLARLQIPPDAIPGSLAETYRRCGKPSCHCAEGQGHPLWLLTFMVQGEKHVERIPEDWVEVVRQRVDMGRNFKEAVAELFAANAQLLVLERNQSREIAKRQSKAKRRPR